MELYLITNKIEGTCYIGKTTQTAMTRWARHLSHANRGRSYHLYNAIRKYGAEAFEVRTMCHPLTEESLNEWEVFLISFYRNQLGKRLYNLSKGGEGASGWNDDNHYTFPLERRKQLSEYNIAIGRKPPKWGIGRPHVSLRQTTDEQITDIRQLYASGHRQKELAVTFELSQAQISRIIHGQRRHESNQVMPIYPNLKAAQSKRATNKNHIRWHVNRGIVKPDCLLCQSQHLTSGGV